MNQCISTHIVHFVCNNIYNMTSLVSMVSFFIVYSYIFSAIYIYILN